MGHEFRTPNLIQPVDAGEESRGGNARIVQQRVAFGAGALLLLVLLFRLDIYLAHRALAWEGALGALLRQGSVLPILFALLALRGGIELDRILRATGARPYSWFAYLMIFLLMLAPWLSAGGWLGDRPADVEGMYWQLTGLLVALVGSCGCAVARRAPAGTVRDLSATILLIFYVGFLSSFAVQLRCGRNVPDQEGAWLVLIILLVTKSADIGGYLVGSLIGRHKLIPSISPGKTVEGLIAGMILAAAVSAWCAHAEVSVAFGRVGIEENPAAAPEAALVRAIIFGLIIAAVGQIGDLVESCFKRNAHAKDSGGLIPQYGGILDLIDSPIVTVAVGWFLLTRVWNVI